MPSGNKTTQSMKPQSARPKQNVFVICDQDRNRFVTINDFFKHNVTSDNAEQHKIQIINPARITHTHTHTIHHHYIK